MQRLFTTIAALIVASAVAVDIESEVHSQIDIDWVWENQLAACKAGKEACHDRLRSGLNYYYGSYKAACDKAYIECKKPVEQMRYNPPS